jgi:hypothetical protein
LALVLRVEYLGGRIDAQSEQIVKMIDAWNL